MASDKRDFFNFESYEGELREDGYYFDPIRYKDSKGNMRVWKGFCRLVKVEGNGENKHDKINWNVNAYTPIYHTKELFNIGYKLGDDVMCQYWYESGLEEGKITVHAPTIPKKTNVGRSNERNVFQQGLVQLRSKWLDKMNKYGNEKFCNQATNILWWPMLAHNFKTQYEKIEYPAWCQPKLNGDRAICYLNKKTDEVIIYSRNGKRIPGMNQIREFIKPILLLLYDEKNDASVYLDGEFYAHDMHLNQISGWQKNEAKNNSTKLEDTTIRYNIFDIFYPPHSTYAEIILEQRWSIIDGLINHFKMKQEDIVFKVNDTNKFVKTNMKPPKNFKNDPYKNSEEFKTIKNEVVHNFTEYSHPVFNYGWIRIIGYVRVPNKSWLIYYYFSLLALSYEGVMIRNNRKYVTNCNNANSTRSYDLQKFKFIFDDEFKITGFKAGIGSSSNLLIWELETLHDDEKQRQKFTCTPKNITNKEREIYYWNFVNNKQLFNNYFLNTLITVEFEELSPSGIPLRAKALTNKPDTKLFNFKMH
jgi:hypothetical protein